MSSLFCHREAASPPVGMDFGRLHSWGTAPGEGLLWNMIRAHAGAQLVIEEHHWIEHQGAEEVNW